MNNPSFKKYFLLLAIFCVTCAACGQGASHAYAADLTVAPATIDGNGLPNDMMNYSITIVNTSGRLINVFPVVYNLNANGDQFLADTAYGDKTTSLTNWISVSRGAILLEPGAQKTIPVGVQISPYATQGTYHAVIAFGEGDTIDVAEASITGAPQTLVTMDVASNAKESLRLDSFSATKRFYSAFPASLSYVIENNGTVSSTPTGEVTVYDRIGHVLGSLDANPKAYALAPGEKHTFTAAWQSNEGFGEYKAVLNITYGSAGDSFEDAVLFWILPWQKIALIFGASLFVIIILTAMAYKKYEARFEQRKYLIKKMSRVNHVIDLRPPVPPRGNQRKP